VANAAYGRRLLDAAGFTVSTPRVFESNALFDTAGGDLYAAGGLLRVRRAGDRGVLTYKGPPLPGKHKNREELEVDVSDADTLSEILDRLSLVVCFRYEKFRTEYRRPGEGGVATLDETPIGVYLELEGVPMWIDRTARRLGFRESAYITASYASLYERYCEKQGIQPSDMTFDSVPPPLTR